MQVFDLYITQHIIILSFSVAREKKFVKNNIRLLNDVYRLYRIKSPDGEYASIPELGLDLNTMRRGNNELILEMADITTDNNPSPKLPPKNFHSRSNSCSTNGRSRLQRALSYGFRRDPAVEQSRDEENKRTERESDLYI